MSHLLQLQWIENTRRLGELPRSAECAAHAVEISMSGRKDKGLSICGNCASGEIFVEVRDGRTTPVQSFMSRYKSCPPEIRRKDLLLVDVSDAHTLAR